MTPYNIIFPETFAEIALRFDTLEDALDEICEWLLLEFDLYFACVYHPSAGMDRLYMVSGSPFEAYETISGSSTGILTKSVSCIVPLAAKHGDVYLIDDCMNDARFLPNPILPHTRSQVAIPLMTHRGHCIGVVSLHSPEPHRFTRTDISWMPQLSSTLTDLMINYQSP